MHNENIALENRSKHSVDGKAYSAWAVIYACEAFMKLMPGVDFINILHV